MLPHAWHSVCGSQEKTFVDLHSPRLNATHNHQACSAFTHNHCQAKLDAAFHFDHMVFVTIVDQHSSIVGCLFFSLSLGKQEHEESFQFMVVWSCFASFV